MTFIKKIPVPICGLALALASLGNFLQIYGQGVRYAFGALAFLIIFGFTVRLILDWKGVAKEIENPAVMGVLPTYDMTWMVLATYISPFHTGIATVIWYAAIVFHAMVIIAFSRKFINEFHIENVFPTWFVMYIGFVVASVTSGALNQQPVGQVLFYLGFVAYLALLVPISIRVFTVGKMPEGTWPTLAIYAAPPHLCLAGYFAAFNEPNTAIVFILLGLGIISYIAVLVALTKLLRLKFYPSFSAFTFPLVISAVAQKSVFAWLGESYGLYIPPVVNYFTTFLAVVIVLYVLIHYLVFLFDNPFKKIAHHH